MKIEREGYIGLQGFVNKDYKARILLGALQNSEVQLTHDGKLRLPEEKVCGQGQVIAPSKHYSGQWSIS